MQTKPSWTTVCKTEEPTGDCVGNDNVPHILNLVLDSSYLHIFQTLEAVDS